jgi:hypothetical protein
VRRVDAAGERRWSVVHKPIPLRPPIELMMEQVEAEPHKRIRLREEDESAVIEITYLLEPTAGGTRFTQVSEVEWKRLPRFLHGTFRRGVERDLRTQLGELKALLEDDLGSA